MTATLIGTGVEIGSKCYGTVDEVPPPGRGLQVRSPERWAPDLIHRGRGRDPPSRCFFHNWTQLPPELRETFFPPLLRFAACPLACLYPSEDRESHHPCRRLRLRLRRRQCRGLETIGGEF